MLLATVVEDRLEDGKRFRRNSITILLGHDNSPSIVVISRLSGVLEHTRWAHLVFILSFNVKEKSFDNAVSYRMPWICMVFAYF